MGASRMARPRSTAPARRTPPSPTPGVAGLVPLGSRSLALSRTSRSGRGHRASRDDSLSFPFPKKGGGRRALLGPPRTSASRPLAGSSTDVPALRVPTSAAAGLSGRFSPPTPGSPEGGQRLQQRCFAAKHRHAWTSAQSEDDGPDRWGAGRRRRGRRDPDQPACRPLAGPPGPG